MNATATSMFEFVPWIVYAPLIGVVINIFFPYVLALINRLFGTKLEVGEKVVGTLATSASGITFVVALLQAYALNLYPEGADVMVAEWIHIGALELDWAFRVDTLSATMMLVVSGVGTLIHIYAIGYMHEDVRFKNDIGRYRRFFVFLNLFIAAMMVLVSGN